jgi:hypothetical protein
MIEPTTAPLVCVAESTPTMKMRVVLLPLMVKPPPLMVTELKIGDSGPDSVTLVCRLMMKPPGGVEAFTWARAALSVPGPPVAPLDEVPGSFPTVTLMTVCACAAGAEPAIDATTIAALAISASALLRGSTPRHALRKFESIRPDPPDPRGRLWRTLRTRRCRSSATRISR